MATLKIKPAPATMDEYISAFPPLVQKALNAVRAAVKKAAPDAAETIKYAIPTFTQNGNLVSFGGWKKHIGFYPAPRDEAAFKDELAGYKGVKSTVHFPFDKPIPSRLIERMVAYRLEKKLPKLLRRKVAKFG